MGDTFHQIFIQTVFAVKYRNAKLGKQWRHELFAVIGNLVSQTGAKLIIVNGLEDHVHCLFAIKPSQKVSDIMQCVKAKSSKWINESGYLSSRFEWQIGYGAFSYNKRDLPIIIRYIENQEAHHQTETFLTEYKKLLGRRGVEFEERYLFEELQ